MKLQLVIDVDYKTNGTPKSTLRNLLCRAGQHLINEGFLTGSSKAEAKAWCCKVLPEPKWVPKANPPVVHAVCFDDDKAFEVQFDASLWFTTATDEEIRKLVMCGFKDDYPADAVAHFMSDHSKDVGDMFKYIELASRNRRSGPGFECRVDPIDTWLWLKKNKPKLCSVLKKEQMNS